MLLLVMYEKRARCLVAVKGASSWLSVLPLRVYAASTQTSLQPPEASLQRSLTY